MEIRKKKHKILLSVILIVTLFAGMFNPLGIDFVDADINKPKESEKNVIAEDTDVDIVKVDDVNVKKHIQEDAFETDGITKKEEQKVIAIEDQIDSTKLKPFPGAVHVKYTLADKTKVNKDTTIDKIYSNSKTIGETIMGQFESKVYTYTMDGMDDYVIAFVDTNTVSGNSHIKTIDHEWAIYDGDGKVINDVIYNEETGIALIPKSYYDGAIVPVQAQLLVSYNIYDEEHIKVPVKLKSDIKDVSVSNIKDINVNPVDVTVSIPVIEPKDSKKVDINDFEISFNDNTVPFVIPEKESEVIKYDKDTGVLTICPDNPMSILDISISVANKKESTLTSKLLDKLSDDAYAALISRDLKYLPDSYIKTLPDYVHEGSLILYKGMNYYRDQDTPTSSWRHKLTQKYRPYYYGYDSDGSGGTEGLYKDLQSRADADFSDIRGDLKNEPGGDGYYNIVRSPHRIPDSKIVDDSASARDTGILKYWYIDPPEYNDTLYRYLPLRCSHISNPIGDNDNHPANGNVGQELMQGVRILVINESPAGGDKPYVVFGLMSQKVNTQSGAGVYKIELRDVVAQGKISVQKGSADTGISNGNNMYKLGPGEWTIYESDPTGASASELAEIKVGTINTNASGYGVSSDIDEGNYWVMETKAPPNYKKSTTVRRVRVTGDTTTPAWDNDTAHAKWNNTPSGDPLDLEIEKDDSDLQGDNAQGAASLKDAEFTISYYDTLVQSQCTGTPRYSWKFLTDEKGRIFMNDPLYVKPGSGNPIIVTVNGKREIKYLPGTYVIEETKAPSGYLLTDRAGNPAKKHYMTVEYNNTNPVGNYTVKLDGVLRGNTTPAQTTTLNVFAQTDVPSRGAIEVTKYDFEREISHNQGDGLLEGTAFEITNKTGKDVVYYKDGYKPGDTGGKVVKDNDVVGTISAIYLDTQKAFIAKTGDRALPIGTYSIKEVYF